MCSYISGSWEVDWAGSCFCTGCWSCSWSWSPLCNLLLANHLLLPCCLLPQAPFQCIKAMGLQKQSYMGNLPPHTYKELALQKVLHGNMQQQGNRVPQRRKGVLTSLGVASTEEVACAGGWPPGVPSPVVPPVGMGSDVERAPGGCGIVSTSSGSVFTTTSAGRGGRWGPNTTGTSHPRATGITGGASQIGGSGSCKSNSKEVELFMYIEIVNTCIQRLLI